MSAPIVSVVIPTHNRHDKLAETLAPLRHQSLSADDYEIIVVDDGSTPPVELPVRGDGPMLRLIRRGGGERSAARNAGADAARGELLVFLDDDITVGPDFLTAHYRAHQEWPGALAVGSIRLPEETARTPFGRFRQRLEDEVIPGQRGPVSMNNFCAAANMSIARRRFMELGGFDTGIASSEDQDLALRHTGSGGRIVFIPEARVVHRDGALDPAAYCRRAEWGAKMMIPFCRRYPDFHDNLVREWVNGPVRLGAEPASASIRKMIKGLLALGPVLTGLHWIVSRIEQLAPESALLDRLYRLTLGVHLQRGYRRGRALY
jgi:GT2 family glycosyltransferase